MMNPEKDEVTISDFSERLSRISGATCLLNTFHEPTGEGFAYYESLLSEWDTRVHELGTVVKDLCSQQIPIDWLESFTRQFVLGFEAP